MKIFAQFNFLSLTPVVDGHFLPGICSLKEFRPGLNYSEISGWQH